jgi:hypothetical protein
MLRKLGLEIGTDNTLFALHVNSEISLFIILMIYFAQCLIIFAPSEQSKIEKVKALICGEDLNLSEDDQVHFIYSLFRYLILICDPLLRLRLRC